MCVTVAVFVRVDSIMNPGFFGGWGLLTRSACQVTIQQVRLLSKVGLPVTSEVCPPPPLFQGVDYFWRLEG